MTATENDRPAEVGTIYFDPATGDTYRLRGYTTDWSQEPLLDEPTIPDYGAMTAQGMGIRSELPDGAIVIWTPSAGARERRLEQAQVNSLAQYVYEEIGRQPGLRLDMMMTGKVELVDALTSALGRIGIETAPEEQSA